MSDTIEQAGAIVIRDGPEILLVRAKRPPHPWVFPKGHIEAGETVEETAHRELREEAGVIGSLIDRVGDTEFTNGRRHYHVVYFLFEPSSDNLPHEAREQRWFAEGDALDALLHDDSKQLLIAALRLFRRSRLRHGKSDAG
jgi:ADP-ribose pyrophosphatase YjhB (NUDIX family)